MPAASDVRPAAWANLQVLFDDGAFSVVAGLYRGAECLGLRWNGMGDDPGTPHEGGTPQWQTVPAYLTEPILHGLLDELLQRCDLAHREAYVERILLELELLKTRVAQI